jgi:hypothetical protein
MTAPTIHLRNQVTAAIGHMRDTDDWRWDHRITERVFAVIAEHESCPHCAEAGQ